MWQTQQQPRDVLPEGLSVRLQACPSGRDSPTCALGLAAPLPVGTRGAAQRVHRRRILSAWIAKEELRARRALAGRPARRRQPRVPAHRHRHSRSWARRRDHDSMFLETSRPGIFAVGDVRHGSIKRAAAAIGEGSMAVRLVFDRLQSTGSADANQARHHLRARRRDNGLPRLWGRPDRTWAAAPAPPRQGCGRRGGRTSGRAASRAPRSSTDRPRSAVGRGKRSGR